MAKNSENHDDLVANQGNNSASDEKQHKPEAKGANPADLLGVGSSNKDLKQQINQLEAALESAQEAVNEHKDKELRAFAEVENMRRKALRDIENARKFALEPFVKELLPAMDGLEHALEAAKDAEPAMREGLLMTEKMLLEIFGKFGVAQVNPEGEKFDPEWHEALSAQPIEGVEPNTVTAVVQKGYQLNGRVVRPARVMVAK